MASSARLTIADIVAEARRRDRENARTDRTGRPSFLTRGGLDAELAIASLVADLVPVQRRFLADESPFKAAVCTRQCGKTFTVARELLITALEAGDRTCVYVNATYGEAKAIMWDDQQDGLPAVLRRHGIPAELNKTRMAVLLPNGSRVVCVGVDDEGFDKLRGQKLDLVVVDEAQKAEGLDVAVASVLSYALLARAGRLVIIGTPNEFCRGYFHDATVGEVDGWSSHRWSMRDVVTRPDIWQAALRTKESMGWTDDDPQWRREGLGEWVRSEAGHILPVDQYGSLYESVPELIPNTSGLPVPRVQPWFYVAGVDLGFVNDPFAIVVLQYSMDEGVIREVHSEQWYDGGTDEQFERMVELTRRFPAGPGSEGLWRFFIDDGGMGKQIAEDFRVRHRRDGVRMRIETARKHSRVQMIEELRTDLRVGRTLVRKGSTLHNDLSVLSWDPDKWDRGIKEPAWGRTPSGKQGPIDHLFDAFRYVWRECQAHLSERPKSHESAEELTKRELEAHRRKALGIGLGRRRGPDVR